MDNSRFIVDRLNLAFTRLHDRSCLIIRETPADSLYKNPRSLSDTAYPASIGENVLRSAGVVEQTFGGLIANLWDDPFEWTLPETLSTCAGIEEYLNEVEENRCRAFASFSSDAELSKSVVLPSDEIQPLIRIISHCLMRASQYQGRAVAISHFLSVEGVRGVTI